MSYGPALLGGREIAAISSVPAPTTIVMMPATPRRSLRLAGRNVRTVWMMTITRKTTRAWPKLPRGAGSSPTFARSLGMIVGISPTAAAAQTASTTDASLRNPPGAWPRRSRNHTRNAPPTAISTRTIARTSGRVTIAFM